MHNTLSLKSNVTACATPAPSLAEQADRLEAFEIGQLQDQLKQANQIIAVKDLALTAMAGMRIQHLPVKDNDILMLDDEIDANIIATCLMNAGIQNVAFVVGNDVQLLDPSVRAQLLQAELAPHLAEVERLEQIISQQNTYTQELEAAGNKLGDDNEALQQQVNQLQEASTKALASVADLEAQLKELNAHNPKRQADKIKAQKKTITEQKATITKMTGQVAELKKDNANKATVAAELDRALDKAVAKVNDGLEADPLFTYGQKETWSVFGDRVPNRYHIQDDHSLARIRVDVENGQAVTPEMRQIPKALMKQVLARSDSNNKTIAAVEAAKNPLNTENKDAK